MEAKSYGKILQEAPAHLFTRFPLRMVHGTPLMEPIADNWEAVEQFQARQDDLLIATYPKAGTTWMQEIVDLIVNNGDLEKASRAPTHVRIPFLEFASPPPLPTGVHLLLQTPSPRVIKTHLPLQLVPKSFWEQNCKVIYVARNPKDNVVSFFFFDRMNKTQPEPGPWGQYLQNFMEGKLSWGSWYEHVRGYWEEKEKRRILYLFYEDMKEITDGNLPETSCDPPGPVWCIRPPQCLQGDPAREIRKVAEFLEVDLAPDVLQKIVHHTSFEAMKENPMANYSSFPDCILDMTCSNFMRKGQVGDWKNHFNVAQNEAFDKHYQCKMAGTALTFRVQL